MNFRIHSTCRNSMRRPGPTAGASAMLLNRVEEGETKFQSVGERLQSRSTASPSLRSLFAKQLGIAVLELQLQLAAPGRDGRDDGPAVRHEVRFRREAR